MICPTYMTGERSTYHSSTVPNQYTPLSDPTIPLGAPSPPSSTRVPSRLERLPTELIQIIFFKCLNLSLPRASSILASALSSFYVKSQLFLTAFCSYNWWLQYEHELLNALHSYPEIQQLQTAILQLRWMTLDFFYQCIPVYLEKELQGQHTILEIGNLDGKIAHSIPNKTAAEFLEAARPKMGVRDLGQYYHTQTNCWFGNQSYLIGMALPDGQMTLHSPLDRPEWLNKRIFSCLQNCRVPSKLLRGPWSEEKCEFLEIVTRGFATVDWTDNTISQVAELGFQEALAECNIRVVRIFTCENENPLFELVSLTSDEYGSCAPRIFDTIGLGFEPTKKHLRLAALNYDCPLEILSMIMEAGHLRFAIRHDLFLNAWARSRKAEGDLRGEWLLEYF